MMGNQHEIMTKNKGIVYGSFFLVFFAFTSVRVVPPATIGVVALFGKCVLQPATLLRALSYSEYPNYVLQYYFNGTRRGNTLALGRTCTLIYGCVR